MIIKAAKRIFNSDKICRSYNDLNFGVTFLEHSVVVVVAFIQSGGHKTKQHIKYMQEYSPKQKNETEMFSDNHARNESVDRSR